MNDLDRIFTRLETLENRSVMDRQRINTLERFARYAMEKFPELKKVTPEPEKVEEKSVKIHPDFRYYTVPQSNEVLRVCSLTIAARKCGTSVKKLNPELRRIKWLGADNAPHSTLVSRSYMLPSSCQTFVTEAGVEGIRDLIKKGVINV